MNKLFSELEKWWLEREKQISSNKTVHPITLRGIYYLMRQRVGVKEANKSFYSSLKKVEQITKIPREKLKIITEPKVSIITRMGENPITKINMNELDFASAVIYIEKSTIIEALEEDKSLTSNGVFIIKGMGFSTRETTRLIKEAQKRGLVIFTLTDFDPSGLLIDIKLKDAGIKTERLGIDLELIKNLGLKITDVRESLPKNKKKLKHYSYLQNKYPSLAKALRDIGVKGQPYRVEIDAVFALAGKDRFVQELLNRINKKITPKPITKVLNEADNARKNVHSLVDKVFSEKIKTTKNIDEIPTEAIEDTIKELEKLLKSRKG